MYSALVGLFGGLMSLMILLAPVVVIIYLLVSDNKKKKANANTAAIAAQNVDGSLKPVAEPVPVNAAPPAPPKPVERSVQKMEYITIFR